MGKKGDLTPIQIPLRGCCFLGEESFLRRLTTQSITTTHGWCKPLVPTKCYCVCAIKHVHTSASDAEVVQAPVSTPQRQHKPPVHCSCASYWRGYWEPETFVISARDVPEDPELPSAPTPKPSCACLAMPHPPTCSAIAFIVDPALSFQGASYCKLHRSSTMYPMSLCYDSLAPLLFSASSEQMQNRIFFLSFSAPSASSYWTLSWAFLFTFWREATLSVKNDVSLPKDFTLPILFLLPCLSSAQTQTGIWSISLWVHS